MQLQLKINVKKIKFKLLFWFYLQTVGMSILGAGWASTEKKAYGTCPTGNPELRGH